MHLHVRRLVLAAALLAWPVFAGVLPEGRADVLYHSYDGGGVEISGPSVLVRKQAGKDFSVSANYYVDSVSSASIDVVTSASPYKEERTQESVGVDYLRGKTLMSLGYMTSDENDYTADTAHFSLSQDIFGDLTTVTLGYARGSRRRRSCACADRPRLRSCSRSRSADRRNARSDRDC